MRLPVLLLAALLAAPVAALLAAPAWAQQNATPDYEAQKKTLLAPRVSTLDELRDPARTMVGRTVEVRGVVKGSFGGGQSLSILLELPDGKTQMVEAAPSFKTAPVARIGTRVRVLCKIQATIGTDVLLQLVNATDAPESQLFSDEASGPDLIRVPRGVPGAPPPGDIIIAPEVDLPAPPPSTTPRTIAPPRIISPARPGTAPRKAITPRVDSRTNAFYGFDEASRSAFGLLARRTNPRLDEESADAIAVSLLEAAQSQNLDPRFLAAIVQVESQFNPYAVSSAGAMGLGQLMPFNLKPLGVGNAWDVRQNLRGSAKLLRQNLNVYANHPNGTMLAVAAYHAGVGAVNRAGRAIPKATTQRYVWKVYYAYRAMAPELFR